MKNLRQRGELALTLSLLGIFISLVGIGLGTRMSQNVQQSASQAQTGSYPYRSVLEVRDENNQVIKWMPGLIWATTYEEKIAGRNNGDIKDKDGNAILVWDTKDVDPLLQGTKAQISIGLPAGYRVVSSFCTSIPTSICDNMKVEPDGLTYSRISIEKNGYIQYGIRIASGTAPTPTAQPTAQPTTVPTALPTFSPTGPIVTITRNPTQPITPTPTPTITPTPTKTPPLCPLKTDRCAPRNVEVDVSDDSVEVSWDKPSDYDSTCGGKTDNTTYWIDIEHAGTDAYIACTGESTDEKDTCKLGKEVFANRILNQNSSEFKNKKWIDGQDYTAKVYLFNPKYQCVSPADSETFTYKPVPDAFCKAPGQDCTVPDYPNRCTASNGKPGLQICHKVGTCTAVGDESKCSWDEAKGSSCTKCESTGPDDSCKYLGGNPNATERIVFLPVGFGSIEEFEQVATPLINVIDKTNLTKYKDRFNYSIYTHIGGEGTYGCKQGGTNDESCDVDSKEAKQNAFTCNGNIQVIVEPASWNVYGGYSQSGRGVNLNVSSIQEPRNTFIHELGHAIFKFTDEYTYNDRLRDITRDELNNYKKSINCSELSNGVCKWGERGKCISGCAVVAKNLYRPSDNSIMNFDLDSLQDGNLFNLVSMDAIDAYFSQRFAFQADVTAEPEYKNAVVLHLSQHREGQLTLQSVDTQQIYPDDTMRDLSQFTDRYYTINVKDAQGMNLWQTQISAYTDTTHDDKGPELTTDFYEYLPYFKTASSILITDAQNKPVLTVNLKEQNIAPPVPAGNLCGNAVCDAGNGETANSCRADCGAQLVKSELERSDLDRNKQVNGVDLSMLIDDAVYSKTDGGDVDGDGKTNALDYSILLKWLGADY